MTKSKEKKEKYRFVLDGTQFQKNPSSYRKSGCRVTTYRNHFLILQKYLLSFTAC
jgi:hypothetical protein